MKIKNIISAMSFGLLAAGFASCENGDIEFPDFDGGTTVYFPYQYPVRTIALGDEEYDTSLDQAHKCQIKATFGGSRNGSNGSVLVEVDKTLVSDLTFADGTPVKALPDNYYKLSTNTLAFNGTMNGTTVVELTDAFFADADAVKNTYVIPLVMKSQTGFDHILTGTPAVEGTTPWRLDAPAWKVVPQDYILYCVKYQNKYTGFWLADGSDVVTDEEGNHNIDRHAATVEKRSVIEVKTKSLTESILTVSYVFNYKELVENPVTHEMEEKMLAHTLTANLSLAIDNAGNITITSLTPGVTATGSGKWVDNGAKKAWNQKDRDMMDIEYTVDFGSNFGINNVHCAAKTKDNLIWQRSGIKSEEFVPTYTK